MRTDRQTAGRGRMGRVWQMPEGNLAMSGLIRLQPGEGNPAELGFVAALALHDVVAGLVGPARLQLKWPNDLLLDGAKLSGILLEREADCIVLGIGVNVVAAPELPDRRTISLVEAGASVSPATLAEAVAGAFTAKRARWREQGFGPVRADWLARAHPLGTALLAGSSGQQLAGLFAGLSEDGALLLVDAAGQRHVVHAGEVWMGTRTGGEG